RVWRNPKASWKLTCVPAVFALTHVFLMQFFWIPNSGDYLAKTGEEISHYDTAIIAVQIVYTTLFVACLVFCPAVFMATIMASASSRFIYVSDNQEESHSEAERLVADA
ncbi:hypothetical protein HDU67_002671, partial [Dinochytrium kinnereticum]